MNESTEINFQKMTIGEIVTKNFSTSAIFEKFGLDFCCNGNVNFSEACLKKGVEDSAVTTELKNIFSAGNQSRESFDKWDLDILADYIVLHHHSYVQEKIPVITEFGQRVLNAHSSNHPEVIPICRLFEQVKNELEGHMFKEEKILFPRIKQMAEAKRNNVTLPAAHFGTIANPIRMMEAEHISAGDALHEIQRLSNNHLPPEDACNTFKAFYFELQAFENDLHKHIHLENNILFPKSIKLEAAIVV